MTNIDIYLKSGNIITVEGEWDYKKFYFSSASYEGVDITPVLSMSEDIINIIQEKANQQCVEREYAQAEFEKELSREQSEEWPDE